MVCEEHGLRNPNTAAFHIRLPHTQWPSLIWPSLTPSPRSDPRPLERPTPSGRSASHFKPSIYTIFQPPPPPFIFLSLYLPFPRFRLSLPPSPSLCLSLSNAFILQCRGSMCVMVWLTDRSTPVIGCRVTEERHWCDWFPTVNAFFSLFTRKRCCQCWKDS